MKPNAEIEKYRVVIIESLPDNEIKTGKKLFEDDLQPIAKADDSFEAVLFQVNTVAEFKNAISKTILQLKGNELVTLHIEAHGYEDKGILLSSKEILQWSDFLDCCRKVNIQLNGLLMVTTAMCYSLPLIAKIDPLKRAPFKAILLSTKDLTVGEIEAGFSAFFGVYRNLLNVFDATSAIIQEVNNGSNKGKFQLLVADYLFDEITNPDRDPIGFAHIVNEHYCINKSKDPTYSKERVESEIRQVLAELSKNGRDFFLFKDVYRQNKRE